MMPKLMAGLMILFAAVVCCAPRDSPPLATIDWSDRSRTRCW